MRKYGMVLCFSVLLLSTAASSAQEDKSASKKNSVEFLAGGTGLFMSLNYSRTLQEKEAYFTTVMLGAGTVPMIGGITLPHEVNFNIGKKSGFLILGLGGSYWTGKSNASGFTETIYSYNVSPIIGWRKHFGNSMLFKAYINPMVRISGEYFIGNNAVLPFGGIGIGYRF